MFHRGSRSHWARNHRISSLPCSVLLDLRVTIRFGRRELIKRGKSKTMSTSTLSNKTETTHTLSARRNSQQMNTIPSRNRQVDCLVSLRGRGRARRRRKEGGLRRAGGERVERSATSSWWNSFGTDL